MKSIVLTVLAIASTSTASAADYPAATTTANATIRVAPSADAPAGDTLPAGTQLSVEICFSEGEYCLVSGDGVPAGSFIAGDLITQDGQGGMTIRVIEQAKWKSIREANTVKYAVPDYERKNIVVWGDSLSTNTFGDELQDLLIGRQVSMQGVPGENGAQIAARMIANTTFEQRIKVIWDRHAGNQAVDNYMADLAPAVDKAKATGAPFIVVSDVPDLDGFEGSTAEADAALTNSINDALRAAYPDNYLDMVTPLAKPSLRTDGLHLAPAGEQAVANAIATFVQSKGW